MKKLFLVAVLFFMMIQYSFQDEEKLTLREKEELTDDQKKIEKETQEINQQENQQEEGDEQSTEKCHQGCRKCDDDLKCTLCFKNFDLHETQGTCSCKKGFHFVEGGCQKLECNSNQFFDSETKECKICFWTGEICQKECPSDEDMDYPQEAELVDGKMICKSNKSSLTMSIILCAVGLVGIYLLVVAYNKYKFTKFVKKLPTDKAVEMADDGL